MDIIIVLIMSSSVHNVQPYFLLMSGLSSTVVDLDIINVFFLLIIIIIIIRIHYILSQREYIIYTTERVCVWRNGKKGKKMSKTEKFNF